MVGIARRRSIAATACIESVFTSRVASLVRRVVVCVCIALSRGLRGLARNRGGHTPALVGGGRMADAHSDRCSAGAGRAAVGAVAVAARRAGLGAAIVIARVIFVNLNIVTASPSATIDAIVGATRRHSHWHGVARGCAYARCF